jgi:catechol 2,3-dioxygenase-like lactoylglutathione lyase family enzyme
MCPLFLLGQRDRRLHSFGDRRDWRVSLQLDCIERFVVAVPEVDVAYGAVSRLGLAATAPSAPDGDGRDRSVFSVGAGDQVVRVELVTAAEGDRHEDADPCTLAFATDDLARAEEQLAVRPEATDVSGCRFVLVAPASSRTPAPNDFPVRRIDHLAILPADLDAATRYWVEVLGVPMHAQIDTATLVIRQMKVGDVIVELLAPAGPESHLTGMAPGTRPMIACEVDDVAACVGLARERGFTIPDPAPGFLPGTLTATIAATEVGGFAIQLLQYV